MTTHPTYRDVLARPAAADLSLLDRTGDPTGRTSGDGHGGLPHPRLTRRPSGRSPASREPQRCHVVVIGAGFGGLEVACGLRDAPVQVTVVDRHNYHTFQPLLYQVATAGLEPGQIAHAVRDIFQGETNIRFRLGTAVDIDFDRQRVHLEDGDDLTYDHLVVAAGTAPQYYGIPGAREHTFALKSLADATNLRSHVLRQFERAARRPERIDDGALTFVVVGGGPTGIEMAGALVELFDRVLDRDFPEIDASEARVVLVEMADRVLLPYDEALQAYALDTLRDRGVEVRLRAAVERVTGEAVHLQGGEALPARTLIWAAGVQAHSLASAIPAPQSRSRRVTVRPGLRVPGYDTAYVIGDMAAATDEDGDLLPQLAPVAVQQGRHVADQIRRVVQGESVEPFRYDDPGIMATIGRNAAVVQSPGGWKLTGWPAWVAWTVLHIWKLIGFRNRLAVMLDWVYSYFTHDRSARLIFEAAPDDTPVSSSQPV